MPDTVRDEAALLTLYADNTAGDVSAQDGRDFIVSIPTLAIHAGNASTQRTALGLGTMALAATADYLALAGGTMTGALTIGNGTITASTPVLDLSQTWNNAAILFEGAVISVTNTASAAYSTILTLKLGGSNRFAFTKDGAINNVLAVNGGPLTFLSGNGTTAGANFYMADGSRFAARSGNRIGWSNDGNNAAATFDTAFARNAAGVVEINNGTAGTYRDLVLRSLTSSGGTITASAPALSITQTWNNGAVTFNGIDMDITNTASAAASTLLDLKVGGSTKFKVEADGDATVESTLNCARVYVSSSGGVRLTAASQILAGSTGFIGFSSSTNASSATGDAGFYRNAAGVIAVVPALSTPTAGAALQFWEQTAPSASAANGVRIYAEDDGGGKTRLMALFATGAAQQIAIEP